MAGSYPDVPGRRIAYDADGTIGTKQYDYGGSSLAPTEIPTADLVELNDEDSTVAYDWGVNSGWWMGLIFPEHRDIQGWYISHATNVQTDDLEYSTNTTNNIDGTWTTIASPYTAYTDTYGTYRTNISSVSLSGVRGIRWHSHVGSGQGSVRHRAFHVYGSIVAGETADRLLYIDTTTGLEYTLPIDWGDIPRGTVYEEDWYIKNNSSTLTANNTNLSFEALYLSSATFYTLSTGVGYSTGYGPISTIGASSRWPPSNSLTVRCDPPSTAELGLHAARIVMDTSSWS